MKKITLLFAIAIMSSLMAFAQNSGKGFNYQAIVRDIQGQILQEETVEIRFGLYPGQTATDPTWQETQTTITDVFGAISLTVGHGASTGGGTVGNYEELDYSAANYWLKVELKDEGVFYEISFQELMTVPYAEAARNTVPAGTIMPFAGPLENIPDGYLPCDGSLVNNDTYPLLYAAIGTSWGGTATQFNLPDCRGMFLRGMANGSGNDPDRASRTASNSGGNTGDAVGSFQDAATALPTNTFTGNTSTNGEHGHTVTLYEDDWFGTGSDAEALDNDASGHTGTYIAQSSEDGNHSHSVTINGGGDNESRPKNVYVNYIIKY